MTNKKASEELRLKYRYLDIRRRSVLENLRLRHKATKSIREYLDGEGYIDVETPILAKSHPEGARLLSTFTCSRREASMHNPQSPQTFKQLLMGAGLDRYYQIVRCFRDEDFTLRPSTRIYTKSISKQVSYPLKKFKK